MCCYVRPPPMPTNNQNVPPALNTTGNPLANRSILISKKSGPFFATEGVWSSYSVQLTSYPQAPVTITLSSPDQRTTAKRFSFVFNQSNWAIGLELMLQPIRDYLLLDSPYNRSLSLTSQSSDPVFDLNGSSTNFLYLAFNSDKGLNLV